jgi:hypothetical protein
MAVPDFQSFMLPLLKLTADGQEHSSTTGFPRVSSMGVETTGHVTTLGEGARLSSPRPNNGPLEAAKQP